ncbi:M23 family peptidase [Desulfosporosinus sp. Sb-LF]|nr:M23 family peptidase [Desulfosporosinus sp. Sb-LF]
MRKWDKSWILVWTSSFLVGGLILCIGYQSVLYESAQEKVQTVETVRTVSAKVPVSVQGETRDGKKTELSTQTEEQTIADNMSQGSSEEKKLSLKADLVESELSIKDFPSPVKGKVFRGIGNYYFEVLDNYLFHGGMDYAEPEGTIIRATHGGKVIFAGQDPILGQKVTLDCGGGWLVTYGGLDNLSVNNGETIETLERIGQVGFFPGAEGLSDQPQLHYEVWHGDKVQGLELKN